jgi:Outer membrane phospholipase A
MRFFDIFFRTVFFLLFISISSSLRAESDITNRNILAELDDLPQFTAFKDNYGTVGTTIGSRPTDYNSDARFQVSIKERFTRSTLPYETHLFFQLTVTSYLSVFLPSFPLHDISYNPGFGLGKHIIKDGKAVGYGYLMIEHESNGFDSEGEKSKSWNKVSLAATMQVSRNLELQAKAWYPIIDGRFSKDILRYQGLGFVAAKVGTNDKRLNLSVMLTPTYRRNLGVNTTAEASLQLTKNRPVCLVAQYHNGYGENLLDYHVYKSRLRVGFSIKPDGFYIF